MFRLAIALLCAVQAIAFEATEAFVRQLSLREKIAQLCVVASIIDEERDAEVLERGRNVHPLYNIRLQEVERLIREEQVGGVIFHGEKSLPEAYLALNAHFQSLSKIPLLVTIDAETGLSQFDRDAVVHFPLNGIVAATQDPELAYQVGREVGRQMRLLEMHVNFAPVVDVNTNPDNPIIGRRSFGADKKVVAEFGLAYMKGLQDVGIIACAKHFPGHGSTSQDSNKELPFVGDSLEELQDALEPFQALIDAGVGSVMTAHLEVPALEPQKGLATSLSKAVVTGLLQEQMGFSGLIFTDALGMKAVADHVEPGEMELQALLAGNDILLSPLDAKKAIDRIERAVLDGEIAEAEIDRKVLKVLKAKKWAMHPPMAGALVTEEAKALSRAISEYIVR